MRPVLAMLLLCAACGGKKSGTGACDVSTDDKVAAFYNRVTGKKLETRYACIDRSEKFPGLISVGTEADDAGCIDKLHIWKCEGYQRPPATEILQAAGWKTADEGRREQIARDWLTPLEKPWGDEFTKAGKTFTPPVFEHGADGSLTVTYWDQGEGTNIEGRVYLYKRKLRFAADGEPGAVEKLDEFSHVG